MWRMTSSSMSTESVRVWRKVATSRDASMNVLGLLSNSAYSHELEPRHRPSANSGTRRIVSSSCTSFAYHDQPSRASPVPFITSAG